MVYLASFLGAATIFAGFASALPRPDSAEGSEVAVSAPNGIILSDTAELSSNLASESAAASSIDYSATITSSYPAATSYAASYVMSSVDSSSYDVLSTSTSSSYYTTSTSSSYSSVQSYGSGSNSWDSSSYDSCVQQCVAEFGAPPATWTPPPTSSGSYSGSGTIHTVIVAPTPGVFRYAPAFINAAPGDTVRFMWNANNHTVTKSSQLTMCNKTDDQPFASGEQNVGFMFDQVVNDTNPVFYYCGTPTHCQKGMFGVINPGNVDGASNTSVASMMPSMLSNSSTLSSMMAYANSMNGSDMAMSWGSNIDMSSFPEWSHQYVMENVLYARALFAKNPDTMTANGTVDMSAGGNPIVFPQDLAAVAASNNAGSDPSSSSTSAGASSTAAASSTGSATSSSSSSAPSATQSNGAGHVIASGAFVGAAIVASLLAL